MQKRLDTNLPSWNELRIEKMNSNPFNMAPPLKESSDENISAESPPNLNTNSFLRAGPRGLSINTGSALQRVMSKQDYDITQETVAMR